MLETPPTGPRDEPTESGPAEGGDTAPAPEKKAARPRSKAVKGVRRAEALGPRGRQKARTDAKAKGKKSTRASTARTTKKTAKKTAKKAAGKGGGGNAGKKKAKPAKGSPKAKRRKGTRA